MSARDDVFANIRRSLAVTGNESDRHAAVADRLSRAPRGVVPARGQVDAAARVALFKAMAEEAQASVAEVAAAGEVPAEVVRYMRGNNLPATLRMGGDPRLAAMPWSATMLQIAGGRSDGSDLNAVSYAFGGVAETGTLILVSGKDNPTTLNFLPENHIVVVGAKDVAGDYETIWDRLRQTFGKGVIPRTVNMITGPSRSADIEQKLFLGAHGPRRLHIIVVREGEAP